MRTVATPCDRALTSFRNQTLAAKGRKDGRREDANKWFGGMPSPFSVPFCSDTPPFSDIFLPDRSASNVSWLWVNFKNRAMLQHTRSTTHVGGTLTSTTIKQISMRPFECEVKGQERGWPFHALRLWIPSLSNIKNPCETKSLAWRTPQRVKHPIFP